MVGDLEEHAQDVPSLVLTLRGCDQKLVTSGRARGILAMPLQEGIGQKVDRWKSQRSGQRQQEGSGRVGGWRLMEARVLHEGQSGPHVCRCRFGFPAGLDQL